MTNFAGKRIYPDEQDHLTLAPGEYGKASNGRWWARPPKGNMGCLDDHEITEHDDGTITVYPSILTDEWHGYLERGAWRE